MESKFARFISYLCHPLFMPTYGLLILFFSNSIPRFNIYASSEDLFNAYVLIGIIFLFTTLIPVGASYYLLKKGAIKSLHMHSKEERLIPFIITGFSYLFAYSMILYALEMNLNPAIFLVILGAQLSILCSLVFTIFWKISIHMIGVGGLIGMELLMIMIFKLDWNILLYTSILIAGIVGFARLRLKAHQPKQVLIGFIVGVLSEVSLILLQN